MSRIEEMLKVAREIARTELELAGLNGRLRALVGETPATPGERLTLTPPGNGSNGHGGNGAAGKAPIPMLHIPAEKADDLVFQSIAAFPGETSKQIAKRLNRGPHWALPSISRLLQEGKIERRNSWRLYPAARRGRA